MKCGAKQTCGTDGCKCTIGGTNLCGPNDTTCLGWNFSSGVDGWVFDTTSGGTSGGSALTASGGQLAMTFSNPAGDPMYVAVKVKLCGGSVSLVAHKVHAEIKMDTMPDGGTSASLQTYTNASLSGGAGFADFGINASWTNFDYTFDSNHGVGLYGFGFYFSPQGTWTGTIYIRNVSIQ